MFDPRTTLLEYTASTSHKLTTYDNGKFCVDFLFKMKDGTERYQMVWCWISANRGRGKKKTASISQVV